MIAPADGRRPHGEPLIPFDETSSPQDVEARLVAGAIDGVGAQTRVIIQ